jgi:hypothetical protein
MSFGESADVSMQRRYGRPLGEGGTWKTSGELRGPSMPQFQLTLSSLPSRLCSPLASLCFTLYETRSFSVRPP